MRQLINQMGWRAMAAQAIGWSALAVGCMFLVRLVVQGLDALGLAIDWLRAGPTFDVYFSIVDVLILFIVAIIAAWTLVQAYESRTQQDGTGHRE